MQVGELQAWGARKAAKLEGGAAVKRELGEDAPTATPKKAKKELDAKLLKVKNFKAKIESSKYMSLHTKNLIETSDAWAPLKNEKNLGDLTGAMGNLDKFFQESAFWGGLLVQPDFPKWVKKTFSDEKTVLEQADRVTECINLVNLLQNVVNRLTNMYNASIAL